LGLIQDTKVSQCSISRISSFFRQPVIQEFPCCISDVKQRSNFKKFPRWSKKQQQQQQQENLVECSLPDFEVASDNISCLYVGRYSEL
jgi:hypothetical protein